MPPYSDGMDHNERPSGWLLSARQVSGMKTEMEEAWEVAAPPNGLGARPSQGHPRT